MGPIFRYIEISNNLNFTSFVCMVVVRCTCTVYIPWTMKGIHQCCVAKLGVHLQPMVDLEENHRKPRKELRAQEWTCDIFG